MCRLAVIRKREQLPVQGEEGHPVLPAFLSKTYALLNDQSSHSCIKWSPGGKSFLILDQDRLATEVLPRYFKHGNVASFVRQLNMYSFHKIGDLHGLEFSHSFFQRDRPDLLNKVRRKTAPPKPDDDDANVAGAAAGGAAEGNDGDSTAVSVLAAMVREMKGALTNLETKMSLSDAVQQELFTELCTKSARLAEAEQRIAELEAIVRGREEDEDEEDGEREGQEEEQQQEQQHQQQQQQQQQLEEADDLRRVRARHDLLSSDVPSFTSNATVTPILKIGKDSRDDIIIYNDALDFDPIASFFA